MSGSRRSVLVSALGMVMLAGCGGPGEAAGDGATATVTATASATVTAKPAKPPPVTSPQGFADLVNYTEYPPTTLRNIAHAICKEVRTGGPDRFGWRQLINYQGERFVGAFIAYSIAVYCPEEGHGLVEAD